MNDLNQVNSCSIIPEESENVSDHLPVRIEFSLLEKKHPQPVSRSQLAQPTWTNDLRNERYLQITSEKLSQIGNLSIPESGTQDIKTIINARFKTVNNILKNAASEAGCIPNKTLKQKAYWCPELSALRDKKRMWWTIWVGCNRPRTGTIFNILKDLKKKFRLCRNNVNTLSRKPIDTLNTYFKNKNMCAFWNKLKSNNYNK